GNRQTPPTPDLPETVGPKALGTGRRGQEIRANQGWFGEEQGGDYGGLALGPAARDKLCGVCGGQGGIRTHGRLPPTAVFKTAALNHSATCPARVETARGGVHSVKFAVAQA